MTVTRGVCVAFCFLAALFAFSLHPSNSSAQVHSDYQAQVQSILAKVAELSAILKAMQEGGSVPPSPAQEGACPPITRTLSRGSQGQDVVALQDFLIGAGVLSVGNATGYFGPLTEAAVKQWQAQKGIVSSGDALSSGYGAVGPKTRAAIAVTCEEAAKAAVLAATVPNIFILSPRTGTTVAGGDTMQIAWRSANAPPQATVSLSLFDNTGKRVGNIFEKAAPTGEYVWRVPSEGQDCAPGEDAFLCISKIAGCDEGVICSLSSGLYRIMATLSNGISATSGFFQVTSGSFSNLVQALAGKPILPSPFNSLIGDATAAPSAPGSCVHQGATYAPGSTLSVECDGNCPSPSPGSGTGFITGACTGGEWCVPFTPYCADSFEDINLSAYEGGGAGQIGSGYAINCPVEGYKAYLSCPYGGCETGWNTCKSNKWVRDEIQNVVKPGTRGPCQSTELWCEVGNEHGFSCVPSWQCSNGKAPVGDNQ